MTGMKTTGHSRPAERVGQHIAASTWASDAVIPFGSAGEEGK